MKISMDVDSRTALFVAGAGLHILTPYGGALSSVTETMMPYAGALAPAVTASVTAGSLYASHKLSKFFKKQDEDTIFRAVVCNVGSYVSGALAVEGLANALPALKTPAMYMASEPVMLGVIATGVAGTMITNEVRKLDRYAKIKEGFVSIKNRILNRNKPEMEKVKVLEKEQENTIIKEENMKEVPTITPEAYVVEKSSILDISDSEVKSVQELTSSQEKLINMLEEWAKKNNKVDEKGNLLKFNREAPDVRVEMNRFVNEAKAQGFTFKSDTKQKAFSKYRNNYKQKGKAYAFSDTGRAQ